MRLLLLLLALTATAMAQQQHNKIAREHFPNHTLPTICYMNDTAIYNVLTGSIYNCQPPLEECFMLAHDTLLQRGVENVYCYDRGFYWDDLHTCTLIGFDRLPDWRDMQDHASKILRVYDYVAVDCLSKVYHLTVNGWIGVFVVGFLFLLLLGTCTVLITSCARNYRNSGSHNVQAEREYYEQLTGQVSSGRRRSTLPTWQIEQGAR